MRHRKVAIVGTGPSIERHGVDFDFATDVAVIAVNGAIEYADLAPHYWFTLDFGPTNRRRLRDRRRGVTYIAAIPEYYCSMYLPGVIYLHRVGGEAGKPTVVEYGLSTDPWQINTGNSAWGALQLAYWFGAKIIALFGVDGCGNSYSRLKGSPSDLTMMPSLFESAAFQLSDNGIDVINGSPESAVDCFPRVAPQQAVSWINNK